MMKVIGQRGSFAEEGRGFLGKHRAIGHPQRAKHCPITGGNVKSQDAHD
ncbi:MAG: hypothetical protein HYX69_08585 [Planctomycetia bacterium]|nr:hypothetical protein [Planctomycetia bacterium]